MFYLHGWTWRTKHKVLTRASHERAIACFWCSIKGKIETEDAAWVAYMASSKDVGQTTMEQTFAHFDMQLHAVRTHKYCVRQNHNVTMSMLRDTLHLCVHLLCSPKHKDTMMHGAGAPCCYVGDLCLSVCGEGWSNLGTLITQCNKCAVSQSQNCCQAPMVGVPFIWKRALKRCYNDQFGGHSATGSDAMSRWLRGQGHYQGSYRPGVSSI